MSTKILMKKGRVFYLRKAIFIFLIVLFIGHLGFRVGEYAPRYLERLSGKYWEDRYFSSQWVIPDSKNSIGDDGLYAYHGWNLVQGGDPSLVNPEVPPLGKYLIGLSILIFENNNIFGLFSGMLVLFAFALLNFTLFKNRLLAVIPIVLFSLEPLFYEQLQASFLDTLHLAMLLLSMYFFLNKRFIFASIFLGFFAAVKFSPLVLFVAMTYFLMLLIQRRKREIVPFLLSTIVVPIIVSLSYLRYFLLGYTIVDFLKLQKFILNFYAIGAKPTFIGMIFPLLIFNKWYTWWNGVIAVPEWRVTWPIIFVGGIASLLHFKKIFMSPFLLLVIWCMAYLGFLLITPVWPRYLLLLLPFLYNLSIWALSKGISGKFLHRSSV